MPRAMLQVRRSSISHILLGPGSVMGPLPSELQAAMGSMEGVEACAGAAAAAGHMGSSQSGSGTGHVIGGGGRVGWRIPTAHAPGLRSALSSVAKSFTGVAQRRVWGSPAGSSLSLLRRSSGSAGAAMGSQADELGAVVRAPSLSRRHPSYLQTAGQAARQRRMLSGLSLSKQSSGEDVESGSLRGQGVGSGLMAGDSLQELHQGSLAPHTRSRLALTAAVQGTDLQLAYASSAAAVLQASAGTQLPASVSDRETMCVMSEPESQPAAAAVDGGGRTYPPRLPPGLALCLAGSSGSGSSRWGRESSPTPRAHGTIQEGPVYAATTDGVGALGTDSGSARAERCTPVYLRPSASYGTSAAALAAEPHARRTRPATAAGGQAAVTMARYSHGSRAET